MEKWCVILFPYHPSVGCIFSFFCECVCVCMCVPGFSVNIQVLQGYMESMPTKDHLTLVITCLGAATCSPSAPAFLRKLNKVQLNVIHVTQHTTLSWIHAAVLLLFKAILHNLNSSLNTLWYGSKNCADAIRMVASFSVFRSLSNTLCVWWSSCFIWVTSICSQNNNLSGAAFCLRMEAMRQASGCRSLIVTLPVDPSAVVLLVVVNNSCFQEG